MAQLVRKLSFSRRKKKGISDIWVPNDCEQEVLNVLESFVDANSEYPNRQEIHNAIRSLTQIADANKLSPSLKQRIKGDLEKIDKKQLPFEQKIDYANFYMFT